MRIAKVLSSGVMAMAMGISACPQPSSPWTATSGTNSPNTGQSATPIHVLVQGERFAIVDGGIDESSRKRMQQDDVMRSGDAFTLDVTLDRPAYAYVFQF